MLLRTYRLTDKLGLFILKSLSFFALIMTDSLSVVVGIFSKGGLGIGGILLAILGGLFALFVGILRFLRNILVWIFNQLGRVVGVVGKRATKSATAIGGKAVKGVSDSTNTAMARRSARVEIDTTLAEDPLRTQNRVLSGLIVVVLLALIGVVVWATSRNNTVPIVPLSPNLSLNSGAPTQSAEQVNPVLNVQTPIPTATPIPAVLQSAGTLAYAVRESGQMDIWAVPVGTRNPLRIVNSAEDDRDPAWSTDGTRLAYASRRADNNWNLYIYDLRTGATSQMTFNLAFEANPRWSPDDLYLVYESYQQDTHLDLFFMRSDGSTVPEPLPASSDAPDFSPAWSPDGRRIAFVSWRDGNQDIYVFDFNTGETRNLTNTPNRHEDYPAWSPDGDILAYSAPENGIETIFTQDVSTNGAPQAFRRGRMPTWSPDGLSIAFMVDSADASATFITVAPFIAGGVATEVLQVPYGAGHPIWTDAPLPPALVNAGGFPSPITDPLFVEQSRPPSGDPPYGLGPLVNISQASQPVLSERVNDSFNALRIRANDVIGVDFLGDITDALWTLEHRREVGEPVRNWHYTGRAFSINRNQVGFPPPFEVVREDSDLATYWRIYVRVAEDAQNGSLGEPLRRMPWDFGAARLGDVEAYNQGGRLRGQMPAGYYVDLTQLARDYGWTRDAATSDWRNSFNGRNYWVFQKREGLAWYDAMRELYAESQLGGFVPTPTPAPRPTLTHQP